MADSVVLLREFADALDKDRGHDRSMVTRVMRDAAEEIDTAAYAFADALIALEELGHRDVAERLRERWSDVREPAQSC